MMQDNHSSESPELNEEPAASADAVEIPPAAAPARKAAPRAPLRGPTPTERSTTRLQPSWLLSESGEQLTREELLARYRRQRALPEDPYQTETLSELPHGYRDSPIGDQHGARVRGQRVRVQ